MKKVVQRFGKWFGYRFAPDNHVMPVLRLEQFHRLEGPGYFRINPMSESTLPAVSLGIRRGDFNFAEVRTADNIPYNINVTVLFKFSPAQAIPAAQPQMVRATAEMLTGIVKLRTEHGLRRLVGRFEAEALAQGETMAAIERDLRRHLHANLQIVGLQPLDNGVMISETVPPKKFQEAMLAVKQHEATLRALAGNREAQVEQAIRAQFLGGLENYRGQVTLLSSLEGIALPSQAEIARYAALRQPAANVAANGALHGVAEATG